ncbi:hypothetical protein [Pandoraea sp. 64-18]|uniref:hypothetical protein n=1 Tax=unclassified Pandoraea TaxID=2624094 RepID=UPI00338EEE90
MPMAREIVPNVNRLASALREAGGHVYWIRHTQVVPGEAPWQRFDEFGAGWGGESGRDLGRRTSRTRVVSAARRSRCG